MHTLQSIVYFRRTAKSEFTGVGSKPLNIISGSNVNARDEREEVMGGEEI